MDSRTKSGHYKTDSGFNQLLQLCTARTAWSDSVIRSETSLITELDRSVIKLVSVLFGKCTTLVITKC